MYFKGFIDGTMREGEKRNQEGRFWSFTFNSLQRKETNVSKKPNVAGPLQLTKGSETLSPPRGTRVCK